MSAGRRDCMRRLSAMLALPAFGAVSTFAQAQSSWTPSGQIVLLNGFSPGGAGDMICRIVAEGIQQNNGVNVIVENRSGANGFLAAQAVSRSAADGHVIGFATMNMLTSAPQLPGTSLPINVATDLTPVASLAVIPSMLVVSPPTQFRSMQELIQLAKASPGKITYGSAGVGSAPHLATELFAKRAGIHLNHIPYKGGAQALVDLRAGRIDFMIGNMPDFFNLIKSNDLIGIGYGGAERLAELPQIPLIKEVVPEFNFSNWFALIGPKDLPQDIASGLNRVVNAALAKPEVRAKIEQLGAVVLSESLDGLQQRIQRDTAMWSEVIKSAGITAG